MRLKQKFKDQKRHHWGLTLKTIQEVYDENIIANNGVLRCIYCHREVDLKESTLEHKQPITRGGTNKKENLTIACPHCNYSKQDRTEKEFRESLKEVENQIGESGVLASVSAEKGKNQIIFPC